MSVYTTKKTPAGRGCGQRVKGKPYLCCGLSAHGLSVEYFIFDPVKVWDTEGHTRAFYLLTDEENITHVVIFIGRSYYPSPWDFVEEARHYGISRRIPDNFPFDRLTPGKSNMYFAHAYALPNFSFELITHPKHCKLGNATITSLSGYHTQNLADPSISLEPQEYTRCTYALRSLSIFHNPHSYNEETGQYTIEKPSYTYSITPPMRAAIEGSYWGINQSVNVNLPYYDPKKLNGAPVHYDTHYAIFMWAPLTHLEFKDIAPQKIAERANQAGYQYEILDY